jgi:hypothetical protein
MQIQKLRISPTAKQALTYFEVETACKRHVLSGQRRTEYRSASGAEFHVLSGRGEKLSVLLTSELGGSSRGGSLALQALFGA